MDKDQILETLHAFIRQRPGLEYANYGDASSYRSEMRSITKDRHDAEVLLGAIARRSAITAEDIIRASQSAYSGRLTIRETEKGGCAIDYCTGQYFPTEYRRAVCAVAASALWDYWREYCMPEPDGAELQRRNPDGTISVVKYPDMTSARAASDALFQTDRASLMGTIPTYQGLRAGDYLRRAFRREFGASIARRWFN